MKDTVIAFAICQAVTNNTDTDLYFRANDVEHLHNTISGIGIAAFTSGTFWVEAIFHRHKEHLPVMEDALMGLREAKDIVDAVWPTNIEVTNIMCELGAGKIAVIKCLRQKGKTKKIVDYVTLCSNIDILEQTHRRY